MSDDYTKLFSSIVHSTVWREPAHVRLVWITMLALADRHGVVSASVPGLADASRVTIPECEDALGRLSAPDPYSRTKTSEGRRILEIRGGWELINHGYYRHLQSEEQHREAHAIRQQRYRDKLSGVTVKKGVTRYASDAIAEAEAEASPEADTETKAEAEKSGSSAPFLAELRKHSVYSGLDLPAVTGSILSIQIGGKKPEWLVAAIADCALKSSGAGLRPDALLGRLIGFCKHAGPQRGSEPPPPDFIEPPTTEWFPGSTGSEH